MKQDKAKEKKVPKSSSTQTMQEEEEDVEHKKQAQSNLQVDDVGRVSRVMMIMERMINQNTFDDVAQGMDIAITMVIQNVINICYHSPGIKGEKIFHAKKKQKQHNTIVVHRIFLHMI